MLIKLLQEIKEAVAGINKYFIQRFDRTFFVIAVLHFCFTFYTDMFVFEYDDVGLFFLIRTKIIFFIILIFIWQMAGYIITNYSKSRNIRNCLKFAGIYFSLMMLFQFALWPFMVGNQMYYGYFSDAIHLSDSAVFQGIFIRYFRIYALMLIPNTAGITIIQIMIISLIIGYLMFRIKNYFNLNKAVYFVYIPFLTPLVIQYNLHIEKDTIYAYSLMFLITNLMFIDFGKNPKKINMKLFFTALLSAVVAAIRPGGIFFFMVTPFVLYLLNSKVLNFKKTMLFIVFSAMMSLIFVPNIISTVFLNKNGRSYGNVYILNDTFQFLLKEAIEEDNEYILDEFDRGTSLTPGRLVSEQTQLCDGFFTDLPQRDKDKFNAVSKKLIKNYYCEYVKYKSKAFYQRLRIIDLNPDIHDLSQYDQYAKKSYNLIKHKMAVINPGIYGKVIEFFKRYNVDLVVPHYALITYILVLWSVCFVSSIVLRIRKAFILICLLIFYLFYLIVVTPYPGFRFYFPVFITMYLFVFYIIFYLITGRNSRKL